jgi:diaminopimelate epimerase
VKIPFAKMHGAGNDVVLIDCLEGDPVADWPAFARFALDRHLGIGGDQLLLVRRSRIADFEMSIYDADGSRAEMCGNGLRACFKYLRDRGHTRAERIRVETGAGVVTPRWLLDERIEVTMTVPVLDPARIPTRLEGRTPLLEVPLEVGGRELRVTPVSMGNPHCVIFVEDPERAAVGTLGPEVECHPAFPARTNVEFVSVRGRRLLEQRTWERGTGETLACGSGACAAAVAAILLGRTERELRVRLRGGELEIRWPHDDAPVVMVGPAAHVFDGELAWP